MNVKDKMYILNDILCEVKPLYLRQRVGARFIDFLDNKIPDNSVVLSEEDYKFLKLQIEYWQRETKLARLAINEVAWKSRKQTASDILFSLKDIIVKYAGVGCGVHPLIFDLRELANQYGVEEWGTYGFD